MPTKKSGKRIYRTKSSTLKKSSSGKSAGKKTARSAAAKSSSPKTSAPQSVDAYFDRLSNPALTALHKMRKAIQSVLPKEAAEIISYSIPAFKLKKVIVWYAAFAHHISLFPTSAVLEQFKDDLSGFITSKGTVQFPLDKPLPLPLIKKMVKARAEQVITGRK